ncbi:hypothetical protein [Nocardia sp. NPDC057353]|uniref:hypothetical protein n=1 Tax=Nocardia sp. NPDC057353 TaxID=3346104 RepID=UPI00362F1556
MRTTAALVAGALLSAASLVGAGTAAAQPATVIPVDGLYLVGAEIQPGWYEAPGTPDQRYGCDWRRLHTIEGDLFDMNHIIGNDFTRKTPVRAEIKATDVAFLTINCGPWRLIPAPPRTGSAG